VSATTLAASSASATRPATPMAVDQPDGRRTAPATAIALAAFHPDAISLAKWSNIIADITNSFSGAKIAGKRRGRWLPKPSERLLNPDSPPRPAYRRRIRRAKSW
jgi:hypothetical protein